MVIISLGGSPGSGKSTLGQLLAQELHLPLVKIGDLRRQYGLERGLTLEQLNERGETDPSTDYDIDNYLKKLPEQMDSFIIDARLGFHFIPQSIKVFVTVNLRIGAERILPLHRASESWDTVEQGVAALEKRMASDSKRYRQYYDIDPYDTSQYDLVLDTGGITTEEALAQLLHFLAERGVHPPRIPAAKKVTTYK
jgi:CMP/dCMP kinase